MSLFSLQQSYRILEVYIYNRLGITFIYYRILLTILCRLLLYEPRLESCLTYLSIICVSICFY